MPNFQKAFENLLSGLGYLEDKKRTELQEKQLQSSIQRQKTLDQLENISKQVANKQIDLYGKQQTWLEYKGRMDTLNEFISGKKDITPAQMESMIKFMQPVKDQFGLDIAPFFTPENEDKSKFAFNTSQALEKEYKNITDRMNAESNQIRAAQSLLQTQIDKMKLENGDDPKTAMAAWLKLNKGKLTADKILDFAQQLSVAEQTGSKLNIDFNEDGTIKNISFGKGVKSPKNMEQATKTEIEKSLVGLVDQMGSLKEVADTEFTDILTYGGRIKNWYLDKLDKIKKENLKPDEQAFLGRAWMFKSNLGKFFDAYRLEVTKSQAAMRELEMLQKRVLNEDMSKATFKNALDYTFDRLGRQIRIKRMLLNSGLTGDALWNEMNKIITSGSDPTLSDENIQARGDQIKEMYISSKKQKGEKYTEDEAKQFAVQQLIKEGYLK